MRNSKIARFRELTIASQQQTATTDKEQRDYLDAMDLSLAKVNEEDISPTGSEPPIIFQGVDLQVIDYYYVADGASYDKHYYIIEVVVEDTKYTVDRSYVDFVELDRRLRKVYPETNLPDLPLEAAATIELALVKEAAALNDTKKVPLGGGQLASTRNSVAFTRDSVISSPPFKTGSKRHHYQMIQIPPDSSELIREQRNPLTLYLVGLTCHHELLTSEAMAVFLDQECASMFAVSLPPPLSPFDLALLNVEARQTVVSRVEEVRFKVPANHLVVWRFSLENFDIGFSVEVNGKLRLPLTRYRASLAPVCGAIEVPNNSVVTLRWNNTYAKLHSKNLTWSVRLVSRIEFDTYKKQAMDCQKEKRQFQIQREALRRGVVRHAERLSGVIHGSIIEAEYEETEMQKMKSLQLRLESALALSDQQAEELLLAEQKIQDLETLRLTMEDSQSLITDSWKNSETQLNDYQHTLEQMNQELEHLESLLQEKDKELHEKAEEEHVLLVEKQITQDNLNALLASLQQAIDSFRADHLQGLDLFEHREGEYRAVLLTPSVDKEEPLAEKVENLKRLINNLLGDILNSNRVLKQNMDLLKQFKEGVEQMTEQLSHHHSPITPEHS